MKLHFRLGCSSRLLAGEQPSPVVLWFAAGCCNAAHVVFSFAVAFAFHAVRGMYLHAERLLAKAGVASARRKGSLTLGAGGQGEGLDKRSAEAWGDSLRARGAEPLSWPCLAYECVLAHRILKTLLGEEQAR